ncbi:MAG: ABC transporter ATP-binding protein [Azospirillaceae bacterium]
MLGQARTPEETAAEHGAAPPPAAPAAAAERILVIERAFHAYGPTVALRDCSLSVPRGEFLTLLGPSGSGKSTLLRIIAGLETPVSVDRLELHGRDIAHLPPNLRNVSTVFQHYALFPHMSVGENVEYGLKLRKVPKAERRAEAEAALALVRLTDKYDRRIHQLSGGERQRVALARSLATKPDILLLDEPLGALDERLRLDMQVELIDLHRKTGSTFILVTHSQEEAITMSDRIVLMRDGAIEQIAEPKELFESPRTAFAARFMGVENVLEGRLEGVEDGLATVRIGDHRLFGRPVGDLAGAGPDTPVFAAIRAERVRFADAGAAERGETVLAGTPGPAIYKGKYRDVPVATPVGEIVVRQWDTEQDARTGTEIRFRAETCVVGAIQQGEGG